MNEIKLGNFQFFCIIFLFELGSAALFGLASSAKQDAWITLLLATILGCLLFFIYLKLYQQFPNQPLTTYSRIILGKYLGWIVGFAYVVYFTYLAARVLRDFEELLVVSQYHQTSILTIGLFMISTMIYVLFKGFEVFSRVTEICFFFFVFFVFLIFILEVSDNLIHFENLLPVLENGWSPVLKSLYPTTITVPFGEMVAFTMILPFLNDKKAARKIGVLGVFVSGLYFTIRTVINIAVIDPDVRYRSAFPVLSEVSLIDIGDFIQRIDSIILVVLVILGFVKIFIFYYCALIGTSDLFKLKKPKKIIFPLGVIIIFSSVIIAPNFNTHLQIGLKIVPYWLHIPFQIVIPIILLAIIMIKSKMKKGRTNLS